MSTEYEDSWNPTVDRVRECLEPLLVLLDLIHSGDLDLTSQGRLAESSGTRLASIVDPRGLWVPPFDECVHEHPLDLLFRLTVRLRLTRIRGGLVRLRKRGRRCRSDPLFLWATITGAFPFEDDEYGIEVAHLLLVLTAAGAVRSEEVGMATVDHLVRSVGWFFEQSEDGQLNSLYAAGTTLAILQLAAAQEIRVSDHPATLVGHSLATRNAILLASAALSSGRIGFGAARPTRSLPHPPSTPNDPVNSLSEQIQQDPVHGQRLGPDAPARRTP